VKMDAARVRAANERLYLPPPLPLALVATSERDGQSWRATTSEPDGDWTAVEFDDDDWTEAPGGFGTSEVRGSVVRTPWRTPGIWLRQSFELDVDPAALEALRFRVHHDEDVDIYLNGAYLLSLPYYTFGYVDVHRDELIRSALRLGRNVLAVHARRTWGGQYIDIGLYGYVADPPSGR
jgi:hypothetical protein